MTLEGVPPAIAGALFSASEGGYNGNPQTCSAVRRFAMVYNVLLERDNGAYVATVPALPGLRTVGATRDATLSAARGDIARRLSEVEVVAVELGEATSDGGYSQEELALARSAAEQRGEPNASPTGKPWLDFAGYLSHLPGEDWDEYGVALRSIRDEGNAADS